MRPVLLVVLDGFGERAERDANAIRLARTPTFDALYADYPHGLVETSGAAVGLPDGQMGNSEVGHMNMGAGRIVYQDLTKINKSILDGDFFENRAFVEAIESVKVSKGKLHLMGLTSPGGVHSSLEHLYALVEMCRRRALDRVFVHAFLDGRDTPPQSGAATLREVEAKLRAIGVGRIASAIGRYYAMDRDSRWERVERAYRLLTEGEGAYVESIVPAIEASYAANVGDEFVAPIVVTHAGEPLATVEDGDAIVFFNFRADRARELTRALTAPADDESVGFERTRIPKLARFVCMATYDKKLDLPVAFPPQSLKNILGEWLASHGLAQFRSAETEKYAHVTFFFNGGVEAPFPFEERRLVPSPRDCATYDLEPAMSAVQVADGVVDAIRSSKFTFLLVNFANPDMVGHTGMLAPAIAAVETIDACIARIVTAARVAGVAVVITADHGNCEQMIDPVTGGPHTSHTTNPVPLLIVDDTRKAHAVRAGGRLCDIAPTVLALMGLAKPPEMEGIPLID